MTYTLDQHGKELLQQFNDDLPVIQRIEQVAYTLLSNALKQQDVSINSIEHRVKTEKSLAGKLELKGSKYATLNNITDLVGLRVITYYTDDVDKVAAIVKNTFDVDWAESIDKRKLHQLTSFGYNSLHYICRLPKDITEAEEIKGLDKYRFEIQMRTGLQHVWSTIEHDIGYKGAVKLPGEFRRQFSRLAGMLELIDDEFSRLRIVMTDHRRKIQQLVASGKLDEVPLVVDTFRSYLNTHPFDRLNRRIAAVNQAEIVPAPMISFVRVLQSFGFNTLGDVEQFIATNTEEAYLLAISQLAFTDLDIIAESVALQNLCIVHILKTGGRKKELTEFYDILNGKKPENEVLAELTCEQAQKLPFMQ
jgi:ppGpp synthetase/RelA/SpoT-type nucleotidyltranferase